jgi:hypothetical protein
LGGPISWNLVAVSSVSAIVLFVAGLFYIRRMENTFADVI